MRKVITFTSFAIACLVVVLIFVSATSYIQLIIAIILYLPLAYFTFKALPRKTQNIILPIAAVEPPVLTEKIKEETGKPVQENVSIIDIDKRAFLKLIGGLGLSVFLLSIFNKRVGGYFSGDPTPIPETIALKDATGNKINPSQNQPTDGYKISEIDDDIITFYGFTNKDSAWFIMKEDTDTGSFRYTKGDRNFPGNWEARVNLKYDYFNNVFKT